MNPKPVGPPPRHVPGLSLLGSTSTPPLAEGSPIVQDPFGLDDGNASTTSTLSTAQRPTVPERRTSPGLQLIPATSLRIERTRWLWAGRLPLGGVSLLVGREGLGKSTLTMHVAAELSRARLDGDLADPASTLVVTFEDDPARTLLPRFLASGGDPSRLWFVEGAPMLPGDRDYLEARVSECGARLLVIDPLSAALGGGKIDTHRDADVRSVMAGLQALAQHLDVSVLGIAHWSKGQSNDPLERVLGSRGFTAAARSVLALGQPDDGALALAPLKSNLGVPAESLALRIEGATARADGQSVATSRVRIVGTTNATAAAFLRGPASAERAVKRAAAEEWLAALLANGPRFVREVADKAGAEGISQATLRRSREALGIEPRKVGREWLWELPAEDAQVAQVAQVEQVEVEQVDAAGQGRFFGEDAQDAQVEHLEVEHLDADPEPADWWSEEQPDELEVF